MSFLQKYNKYKYRPNTVVKITKDIENTNEVSTQLTTVLTALVKPSREAQKDGKKLRNLIHRFGRSYKGDVIYIHRNYYHEIFPLN